MEACGPEDAGLLAEVGERTFRETYAADTSPEDMEGYVASAYEPAAVERQLRDPESKFFLARVGGAAAGYLKVNRGGAQTELREEAGMEIESLYVLRRFQGGRLLLERALEEARERGAEYVWLGVWESNERARRFWQRHGFAEFGAHPFKFGEIEHTDLMMRRPVGQRLGL